MESLYVCHFSNGHIKVGRSIDAKARVAVHADRVACLGILLAEHFIVECVGACVPAEAALIAKCASMADRRHMEEWFTGLDYGDVCRWACEAAEMRLHAPIVSTRWSVLLAQLAAKGVSQSAVARHCGMAPSSINRLANGQQDEPLHSVGEAMLALHRTHCAEA